MSGTNKIEGTRNTAGVLGPWFRLDRYYYCRIKSELRWYINVYIILNNKFVRTRY